MRITVEIWFALFTVFTHRVVLAIVANSTRYIARCIVDGPVKMATKTKRNAGISFIPLFHCAILPCRMVIAFTAFALIRLLPNAGPPGRIIVEVLAIIAVQALCVVRAFAFAMNHVGQSE